MSRARRNEEPPNRLRTCLVALAVAVVAASTVGCAFPAFNSASDLEELIDDSDGPNGTFNAQASGRATVYEVPGKIHVQHGHACTDPERGGTVVRDQAVFPAGFDEGTVIFNGSVARYKGNDHHVKLLGAAISHVRIEAGRAGRELHWSAAGALTDDEWNASSWCYFYTLVFWRRASDGLQAIVLRDARNRIFGEFDESQKAVHDIAGAVVVPDFLVTAYGGPRALLPLGHAMWFSGDADHAFFQAGFDLGAPTIRANSLSWRSQSLLKDDDAWRRYASAELVEVMNGPSVHMWQPSAVSHFVAAPVPHWALEQPSFALEAQAPDDATFPARCVASPPDRVSDHYAVDVPFTHAVPMLTGWELTEPCDDSHVREIGAYLDTFSFTPYANGRGGLLRYTVVSRLSDDDGGKLGRARHKVTILGFNAINPGGFDVNDYTSPVPTGNAP